MNHEHFEAEMNEEQTRKPSAVSTFYARRKPIPYLWPARIDDAILFSANQR